MDTHYKTGISGFIPKPLPKESGGAARPKETAPTKQLPDTFDRPHAEDVRVRDHTPLTGVIRTLALHVDGGPNTGSEGVDQALERLESASARLVELRQSGDASTDDLKKAFTKYREALGMLSLAVGDGNSANVLLGGIWN